MKKSTKRKGPRRREGGGYNYSIASSQPVELTFRPVTCCPVASWESLNSAEDRRRASGIVSMAVLGMRSRFVFRQRSPAAMAGLMHAGTPQLVSSRDVEVPSAHPNRLGPKPRSPMRRPIPIEFRERSYPLGLTVRAIFWMNDKTKCRGHGERLGWGLGRKGES